MRFGRAIGLLFYALGVLKAFADKINDVTVLPSKTISLEKLKSPAGDVNAHVARAKLHQQIVDLFLQGIPTSESPTLLFAQGSTPSPAVQAVANMSDAGYLNLNRFVWIDADKIKLFIPEYREYLLKFPARADTIVGAEVRLIQEKLLREALRRSISVVYNANAVGPEWVAYFVNQIRKDYSRYKLGMVRTPAEPNVAPKLFDYVISASAKSIEKISIRGRDYSLDDLADGVRAQQSPGLLKILKYVGMDTPPLHSRASSEVYSFRPATYSGNRKTDFAQTLTATDNIAILIADSANIEKELKKLVEGKDRFRQIVVDVSKFSGSVAALKSTVERVKSAVGLAKEIILVTDTQKSEKQLQKLFSRDNFVKVRGPFGQTQLVRIGDGKYYAPEPVLAGKNIGRVAPLRSGESGINLPADAVSIAFRSPHNLEATAINWHTAPDYSVLRGVGVPLEILGLKDSLGLVAKNGKGFVIDNLPLSFDLQQSESPLFFDHTPVPPANRLSLVDIPSEKTDGIFIDHKNRQSDNALNLKALKNLADHGTGLGFVSDVHLGQVQSKEIIASDGTIIKNKVAVDGESKRTFENTLQDLRKNSQAFEGFIAGGDLVDNSAGTTAQRIEQTVEAHRRLSEALNQGNIAKPKPLYVILGNHDEFRFEGSELAGAQINRAKVRVDTEDYQKLVSYFEKLKLDPKFAKMNLSLEDFLQPDRSDRSLRVVIDLEKRLELVRRLEAPNASGQHDIRVLFPDALSNGFVQVKKGVYVLHKPPFVGPNIGRILTGYEDGKNRSVPADARYILLGDQHVEYQIILQNYMSGHDTVLAGAPALTSNRAAGNKSGYLMIDPYISDQTTPAVFHIDTNSEHAVLTLKPTFEQLPYIDSSTSKSPLQPKALAARCPNSYANYAQALPSFK